MGRNKKKQILPKQIKVKDISKQQKTKTSTEAIDNQQQPQLIISNITNFTKNRKQEIRTKIGLPLLLLKG